MIADGPAIPPIDWRPPRLNGRRSSLRLLMVGPTRVAAGGVRMFVDVVLRHLGRDVSASWLEVGTWGDRITPRARVVALGRAWLELRRRLRAERFDAIQFNPSLDPKSLIRDGILIRLASGYENAAIVASIHGWDVATEQWLERSRLARAFLRATLGRADQVTVLASGQLQRLTAWGLAPERVTRIDMLYDSSASVPQPVASQPEVLRVLYLGRVIRAKGVFELVSAMARLQADGVATRCRIVGDGEDLRALRSHIEALGVTDVVELCGHLEGSAKAQALVDSDVFVLATSYGEGCPIALLEAMASGLAVIATRVAGIPEIVRDGDNGVLLGEASAEAVRAALAGFAADRRRLRAVGRRNRVLAARRHSAPVVVAQLEALYRDVINRKGHVQGRPEAHSMHDRGGAGAR